MYFFHIISFIFFIYKIKKHLRTEGPEENMIELDEQYYTAAEQFSAQLPHVNIKSSIFIIILFP